VHERYRQTNKQDYYGNTALCTKVHRVVKNGWTDRDAVWNAEWRGSMEHVLREDV